MRSYALRALTALLLFLVFGTSVSQTVISNALLDMTKYFGAATRLVGNAISGINNVEAAQIPKADREAAADELNGISLDISKLRSRQAPLLVDLSDYVKNVRDGTLQGNSRRDAWEAIVDSVNEVAAMVTNTLYVVENSRWLKVALDPQDRLALREVLLGRAGVLTKLSGLPPPSTADEINQLERMNEYYRTLIVSLGELNVAITRATERLSLE